MIALFWIGYVCLALSLLARCYYRTFIARRLQFVGLIILTFIITSWVLS